MEYIGLSYETYNTRNYIMSFIIFFIYITFISSLYLAIKFEVLNKRNQCDLTFYYGKPCRDLIENNVFNDSKFKMSKHNFFDNVNQNVNPVLNTKTMFSGFNQKTIDKNIKTHDAAVKQSSTDAKSQFQVLSDALNYTVASILGNLNTVVQTFTFQNEDLVNGIDSLTQNLQTPGSSPIISAIKPTVASTVAPLQKLYKSLTMK
jgi:hypothetical protein